MSVGNPEKPGAPLRANENGVRQIADAKPVLACTLTAQFEVELATQALLNYFGVTLDELKNWTSIGLVHPDDLESVIAKTRHSTETGEPFDFEHRCRRFDGVFRRLQARGIPFQNPQGQIERWYALLTDMEDQRQAEEALRTSERSLNLIITDGLVEKWASVLINQPLPYNHAGRFAEIGSNPTPAKFFRNGCGCARAAEEIRDKRSFIC